MTIEAHSKQPAKQALAALLRERGYVNDVGNVVFERLYQEIEAKKLGYGAKHLRRMVNGGPRPLKPDAARFIADHLGVEPTYFMEYRVWEMGEALRARPALVDLFYTMVKTTIADVEAIEPQPNSRRSSGK